MYVYVYVGIFIFPYIYIYIFFYRYLGLYILQIMCLYIEAHLRNKCSSKEMQQAMQSRLFSLNRMFGCSVFDLS